MTQEVVGVFVRFRALVDSGAVSLFWGFKVVVIES
jgi:hypothetical protein